MIHRTLEEKIAPLLRGNKAIIINGARQVGKSTLLKMLLDDSRDALWLNGDDTDVQEMFSGMSSTRLRAVIGNKRLIVIDEAQRIKDIGLRMKLITDQMDGVAAARLNWHRK